MTEGVFNCLIDKNRTEAFKKAIDNTVKNGDIVADMGTGSGVLAMFAADAGARKVYAIEIDKKNIKTLKDVFKENGYEKIIEVVDGDVTKIILPEKVDVIIGEMIATGLIEELQIPAMNNILRNSQENVRVVLNKFENYVDLVFNNNLFYGKKFDILRYEYSDWKEGESESFSEKKMYSSVDFSIINENNNINKNINLKIVKSGKINGIRISSKSIFFDGSSFDFSFAYSYPIIIPINNLEVNEGDEFIINITYEMCAGFNNFSYSIIKK